METSYKLLLATVLWLGVATRPSLEYVDGSVESDLPDYLEVRDYDRDDESSLLETIRRQWRKEVGDQVDILNDSPYDKDEIGMVALIDFLNNKYDQKPENSGQTKDVKYKRHKLRKTADAIHRSSQGGLKAKHKDVPIPQTRRSGNKDVKKRSEAKQFPSFEHHDSKNHVEVAGLSIDSVTSEVSTAGDAKAVLYPSTPSNNNKLLDKQFKEDQNNYQTASIVVEDSVSEQEKNVAQLDPDSLFLETRTINSTALNESVSLLPGHVKVLAPTPVAVNKGSTLGIDRFTFIGIVAACCVAGVAGVVLAAYCWFKLRQETSEVKNSNYPRKLGRESSTNSKKGIGKRLSNKDDELVQSAEVFHYLHAKKQLSQIEKVGHGPTRDYVQDASDSEDDDEDTVYECPGLAPPGDMKVVNPLFSDAERHSDVMSDSSLNNNVSPPVSNDPPLLQPLMRAPSK